LKYKKKPYRKLVDLLSEVLDLLLDFCALSADVVGIVHFPMLLLQEYDPFIAVPDLFLVEKWSTFVRPP